MNAEQMRGQYRPEKIALLLIGESPPAGGTFFYAADSHLFRHTVDAFALVYGPSCPVDSGFLESFKLAGCYLEDLCLEPVNHLTRQERRQAQRASIESLSSRLVHLAPQVIVLVLCAIRGCVAGAAQGAGFVGTLIEPLPFPAMGHQRRFVTKLAELVAELRLRGLLPRELGGMPSNTSWAN